MPIHPSDSYNPFPTTAPETSGPEGGTPMRTEATPAAFGAQVGEAEQKVGAESGDLANKYFGIANDTAMVTADTAFATKVGKIKGDYMSLTGSAAAAAFPQYQQDVSDAFQEARKGLVPGAQRGFDLMASRTMANHIADGSAYAASQAKEANRDAYSSMANAQFSALLDPNVAGDPVRSQYHIDSLKYAAQAQIDTDHPGLTTDPKTGVVSFDDSTPAGQNLRSQYQQNLDSYLSKGYYTKYSTLANVDTISAHNAYQQERDQIPRAGQVALDSYFGPKVLAAHTAGVTANVLADAHRDQYNMLTNPQQTGIVPLSVRNNNPGNLRDSSTGQFRVFNTPEEGAKAMQDDLTAKISGNSPAMEKNFGKGYSPTLYNLISTYAPTADKNDPKAYTDTVSKETGIASNQVLTTADIPKLQAAMTKVEAGGSGSNSINQKTENASYNTAKSYATNENGGPITQADYYRTHSQEVYARGDAYAEKMMPGDLALKRTVRQSLENQMNKTISNDTAQHLQDNRNIVRAINGDFTNKKPPETEADLRAIPGISSLLDSAAARDPKFAETIPTMIAKTARSNDKTNSVNAYDTMLRVLEPNDGNHPNAILSQDHLDKLLGRSDGTGINYKDYTDAKQSLELPDRLKTYLNQNMQTISTANGNVDGMGKQRALQFYQQAMDMYKTKTAAGISVSDLVDPAKKDYIGLPATFLPSRAEQIQNLAKTKSQTPFDYDAIKKGNTYTAPDGSIRTKQ